MDLGEIFKDLISDALCGYEIRFRDLIVSRLIQLAEQVSACLSLTIFV